MEESMADFYTESVALSIKSEEADRLARQVAAATGESLTDAVVGSLRERLERLRAAQRPSLTHRIRRLQQEARELEVRDPRSPEEILGYDDDGLPR
jgi:antitoxin VapB